MGPEGFYSLYSFAYIIGVIVSVIALVYFFQMASDIRKIRSLLAKQVEGYDPEELPSKRSNVTIIVMVAVALILAIVIYFVGR